MSIEKAEIKRLTAQTLGKKMDQKVEAAKAEFHRFEGAKGAMSNNVIAGLVSVKAVWKKNLEDEQVTKEEADLAMRVVSQCEGVVRNLIEKAAADLLVHQGKLQGLELGVQECERLFNEEGAKAQALLKALEEGNAEIEGEAPEGDRPNLRVVGTRPGPSVAQQRKAESQDKATEPEPPPPKPEPPENQVRKEGEQPPKPKGRKKSDQNPKLFPQGKG